MKHITLILLLAFTSLAGSMAQAIKKINYQVNIGSTISFPYEKSVSYMPGTYQASQTDYSSDIGYFAELMLTYNMTNRYAISTALNYTYSAVGVNDKIGAFHSKGKIATSYLNIPLLFKYRLTEKVPLSLGAGPYIGFLLTANESGTTHIDIAALTMLEPEHIEPTEAYDTSIKENYTTIDYGLSLQLDYEIKLSAGLKGVVLTRFNYGLKNTLTCDQAHNSTARNWKNYNVMLGLGLIL